VKRKYSLFSHTAATVATGLIIFQIVSGLAIAMNIVFPLAQRSADDLAIVLVLSARTWQESSAQKRQDLEQELYKSHGLRISSVTQPLEETRSNYPYLDFLRTALNKYLPENQQLRLISDAMNTFR